MPPCRRLVATGLLQPRRDGSPLGRDRAGTVRFRAAGGARPLQLPAGGHLPAEALEHRRAVRAWSCIRRSRSPRPCPRTQAFLDHSAVPVQFTEEDFDQVLSGNFVTKVIYLPNPEYPRVGLGGRRYAGQHAAGAGHRSDHRGHPPRGDPGGHPPGQQGLAAPPPPAAGRGNGVTPTGFHAAIGGRRPGGCPWRGSEWRTPTIAAWVLHCRRHRAAVWDADVRHAHRPAWSAARALGSSRRTCRATPSSTIRTSVCRNRRTRCGST